jgi:hypothetical protein
MLNEMKITNFMYYREPLLKIDGILVNNYNITATH